MREYDDDGKEPLIDNIDEEKKEMTGTTECFESESEMRGVHAIGHIPPNTLCMLIPRRCLITVEMGQATPIGQAIMSSDLDLDAPKHIFLMIYILWDRKVNGVNSFFHPYYEILPRTLSNMPIFWSQSELAELEGSYLLHQIADRNAAIEEDYHSICQIAPLDKICTMDEFKWARMCVCSRNFGLQIDGHRTSALVPHADMLNHYRPRETKWTFDEDRQAFTITTLQYVQAGAEVFDSYGQKCNHRFLLNYGFAVEDNRELDGFCPNEVPVELYVSESDPLYSEKLDFWTRGEVTYSGVENGATSNCRYHSDNHDSWHHPLPATPVVKRVRLCAANNENTRLLLSLLRTLACNAEELHAVAAPTTLIESASNNVDHHRRSHFPSHDNMSRSMFSGLPDSRHANIHSNNHQHHNIQHFHHNVYRPSNSHTYNSPVMSTGGSSSSYQRSCRDLRHPISLRNERETMHLLLQVVNRHLHLYSTTLQQDCADLQDLRSFPRFSNRRHAKIQVKGEKEVLHHYASWARTALDVLDVLEDELNQERGISGNVEVRLVSGGHQMTVESSSSSYHQSITSDNRPNFEYVIRHLEEDESVHHTILRYCADVLGSLRREEFKAIRRHQRGLIHHRATQSTPGGGSYSNNNSNSMRHGYS